MYRIFIVEDAPVIAQGVVCLLAIPTAILLTVICFLWSFADSLTTPPEEERQQFSEIKN